MVRQTEMTYPPQLYLRNPIYCGECHGRYSTDLTSQLTGKVKLSHPVNRCSRSYSYLRKDPTQAISSIITEYWFKETDCIKTQPVTDGKQSFIQMPDTFVYCPRCDGHLTLIVLDELRVIYKHNMMECSGRVVFPIAQFMFSI